MKFVKIFILIVLLAGSLAAYYFVFVRAKIGPSTVQTGANDAQAIDQKNISAIVVPHHDLMKKEREGFFTKINDQGNPETVIVVATNHFNAGSGDIITTNKKWIISGSKIEANEKIITGLNGLASNDDEAFSEEHGIKNILPNIAETFPSAKIVPIIIKARTDKQKVNELSESLFDLCVGKCLLVGSVDFSHYQPGSLAEIHDDLSLRLLENADEELVDRAEVDSREALLLLVKWAKLSESTNFSLYENTNSGKINNERDAESTSYILGSYLRGEIRKAEDRFTFMIGGDMMFDRNIEYTFQGNKIFDAFGNFGDRVFAGTDLSLANLEGPVSPTQRTPVSDHSLVFNFQPNTPSVLSWLGINAVSLANNHTLNNGQTGLSNTKKVLPEAGIAYVGQDAKFNDESVKTFENGSNIKLSVLALDCLNTTTDLESKIKSEKEKGNYVLIFPHWGNEYETTHSKSQENLAHKWIDAGADFVFGGHPHVIQDAEIYKGKPIFYSLGNFLFDQDFSPETQRGLIVAVRISKANTELVLLPTVSKKYKPELLTGAERTAFLKQFRKYLGMSVDDNGYGYDKIELNN